MSLRLQTLIWRLRKRLITYIVWDFDGTLWQNRQATDTLRNIYFRIARQHSSKDFSQHQFDCMAQKYGDWAHVVANITDLTVQEARTCAEHFFVRKDFIEPDQKIVQFVENLDHSGFRNIVLTSAPQNRVIEGLATIGFRQKDEGHVSPFYAIFGKEQTGAGKPNPEAFHTVLSFTRLPSYAHLMIGDSQFSDIVPAKVAGFQAIHIRDIKNIFPEFESNFFVE